MEESVISEIKEEEKEAEDYIVIKKLDDKEEEVDSKCYIIPRVKAKGASWELVSDLLNKKIDDCIYNDNNALPIFNQEARSGLNQFLNNKNCDSYSNITKATKEFFSDCESFDRNSTDPEVITNIQFCTSFNDSNPQMILYGLIEELCNVNNK